MPFTFRFLDCSFDPVVDVGDSTVAARYLENWFAPVLSQLITRRRPLVCPASSHNAITSTCALSVPLVALRKRTFSAEFPRLAKSCPRAFCARFREYLENKTSDCYVRRPCTVLKVLLAAFDWLRRDCPCPPSHSLLATAVSTIFNASSGLKRSVQLLALWLGLI